MTILGYILLFYVGFYYYRLAENHKRNKWLYGFLGIVLFILGTIFYPLFLRFFLQTEINEFDLTLISFKSIFIGIFTVFFCFHFLDFVWKRNDKLN